MLVALVLGLAGCSEGPGASTGDPPPPTVTMKSRVWIDFDEGGDERPSLTAMVETTEGAGPPRNFTSLDAALGWARDQSPRVVLTVNGRWSVGSEPVSRYRVADAATLARLREEVSRGFADYREANEGGKKAWYAVVIPDGPVPERDAIVAKLESQPEVQTARARTTLEGDAAWTFTFEAERRDDALRLATGVALKTFGLQGGGSGGSAVTSLGYVDVGLARREPVAPRLER